MYPNNMSAIVALAAQRQRMRKQFKGVEMTSQDVSTDLIRMRRRYLGTDYPITPLIRDSKGQFDYNNAVKLADYLEQRSIWYYKNACRENLGIPDGDLYRPAMLQDLFGGFLGLSLMVWQYTNTLPDCIDEIYDLALEQERNTCALSDTLLYVAPRPVCECALTWTDRWGNPPCYFSESILVAICMLVGSLDDSSFSYTP